MRIYTPAYRLSLAQAKADELQGAFADEAELPRPPTLAEVVSTFPTMKEPPASTVKVPKRRSPFALKRSVTDSADPRQGKTDGPVIFSFKRDSEAAKAGKERNQYTLREVSSSTREHGLPDGIDS